MKKYFYVVLGILFLAANHFCMSEDETVIEAVFPSAILIPANNQETATILKGKGLEKIQSITLVRDNVPEEKVIARLNPAEDGQLQLNFNASVEAAISKDYKLQIKTESGLVECKATVEVADAGDSRIAKIPTLQDLEAAADDILAPGKKPAVTQTVPSPFVLKEGDNIQATLIGTNLKKITEIKIHPQGKSSEIFTIPFEKTTNGGLSMGLTVPYGTKIGSKYTLELYVRKRMVATVTLEIIKNDYYPEELQKKKKK